MKKVDSCGLKNEDIVDDISMYYDINTYKFLETKEQSKKNNMIKKTKEEVTIPTPKEVVNFLDESIIGQDDLKKTLAVAVCNHYKRVSKLKCRCMIKELKDVKIEKSNIIILGDTGTGKTYTVKKISEFLKVPYYIADCTKFTESGYVGVDVESCLSGLVTAANGDIKSAEKGIIMLDEIDKIARKGIGPSITRDVGGESVQQELLKIVEGGCVNISLKNKRINPNETLSTINTDNILFIALGAFEGLNHIVDKGKKHAIGFGQHDRDEVWEDESSFKDVTTDDLCKYGMIPEFIGRFPVVTYTNRLSSNDLYRILVEPKNSLIKQYQKLFAFDGVKLNFTNDALGFIAEIAEQQHVGARGLRGIIEKVLMDIMYEYLDGSTKKVEIDEAYVRYKYGMMKVV